MSRCPALWDAHFVGLKFQVKFSSIDLMNLPDYNIYLKLMIDGTRRSPWVGTPSLCG